MAITVSYNGVTLNDDFIISNLSRPLPEFRDSSSEIEGADGEVFDGLTIGVRECSFELIAKRKTAKAVQQAARKLMELFLVREPKALMFSDEKDKENIQLVRYAVPSGTFDAESFLKAERWTCRFKQLDPYLYGKTRSVTIHANKSTKVNIGGNAAALPTAWTMPINTKSSYTLSADGSKQITFNASFNGSTSLVIDFEKQTAKLSNTLISHSGLQVGSRFFEMSGAMTLTATSKTDISWRERWL